MALINAGAQLDLQTDEGCTALMDASCGGQTEIAVALINAGAQLDLQNYRGDTALMVASVEGCTEIAVALINAGAQLDLQNDEGCTASDLASAHGHPEIVQALNHQQQRYHRNCAGSTNALREFNHESSDSDDDWSCEVCDRCYSTFEEAEACETVCLSQRPVRQQQLPRCDVCGGPPQPGCYWHFLE